MSDRRKAVLASSIVPNLHAADDDSSEEEVDGPREDVVDDLSYDIYNLTACNYHAVRFGEGENKEDALLMTAQRATQLLIKRLSDCPKEASDVGPLVVLPKEVFVLPRAHKLIEEKPETKWEKFAREKGIKNTKRERMVYDEDMGEFRPRYGYKRANNGIEDIPIVEIKEGQDPYADPWSEERKEKKQRVQKNAKNQIQNTKRALGAKGKFKEFDPKHMPGIPVDLKTGKGPAGAGKKLRGKEGVRMALQLAQQSTASMGRFDDMRKGEPERKLKGKKRSFRDNLMPSSTEKDLMKSQLRIVADKVDKKKRGVTNSLAAYEGIIPDAPSDSFKVKKGKAKNRNKSVK